MLSQIGEVFDSLGEFKNKGTFGDISEKCGSYKSLDESKWPGLLDSINKKEYKHQTFQEERSLIEKGV